MLTTFRNRNFSLLWLAGLISLMGNWMLIAALPFHIYAITGSALATSGWLIAYILPGVLFSSVAGVFVDRWDRRKTMIVVNILQMLVIPFLLIVQSPEWVWVVYVVGFLESTLSQFFGPAESALLPTLVEEQQLVSANSLNALNDNLARIIGPAIGGVLLGVWGLSSVVFADAISYLAAALLIVLITLSATNNDPKPKNLKNGAGERFVSVWRDWIAGLKLVTRNRILVNIFVVASIALFADAIISAVLVVFVQGDAGLNATEFGWMLTARGVGGMLGGLLLAQIGQKLSNRQLASGGLFATGILLIIMLAKPTVLVLVVTTGLAGIPSIAWIVAVQTSLQQTTTDSYRGRVFGAFGTTASLLMLVGSVIAGASADLVGGSTLILAAAIISILSGLFAWVLFVKKVEEPVATAV